MSENKKKLSVIVNENFESEQNKKNISQNSYQTNPFGTKIDSLKNKLIKHANDKGSIQFSIEDLLR